MDKIAQLRFWEFIRGDLPTSEFESWLYQQNQLESFFGSEFYLDLISTNFQDKSELYVIRQKLKRLMPALSECLCHTLANLDMIPMGYEGLDQQFFATVESLKHYGEKRWWLHLCKCQKCSQDWLVAEESRIYDDHYIKRLSQSEADIITAQDIWPDDFSTYEQVLEIGSKLSRPYHFDEVYAPSLLYTTEDLRLARPNITNGEIANLLGITVEHVKNIIKFSKG
jgi:hypothetical protein